jgi:hypothetical protein
MPAWLSPTLRATSWCSLAAVAVCLAAATALSLQADTWPTGLLGVVAASVAAATVAGLRDPAAALLSAVPTSAAVRRVRRLVLLAPAALAGWLAWVGVGHHWVPALGWPVAGLAALTATGVAVAVWAPARLEAAAGAAVPLTWVVTARSGGFEWDQHSELVTAAAGAAIWMGRNR